MKWTIGGSDYLGLCYYKPMRVMKSQPKYLRIFVVSAIVFVAGGSAGVYAYSQLDFGQQANVWQERHCTQRLADQKQPNHQIALCYSLQQSQTNKEDIAEIQSKLNEETPNSSFYKIIDHDFKTPNLDIGLGGPYISRAIVPKNGKINTLTVTKLIPESELSNSATFTLYVNDLEQELEATVDAENPDSLTVIDGIEVENGDIVAIKKEGDLGSFTNPLRYHIALYIESD